ncbi:MAG: RNA methyltransferase [Cryomorphaceae bacterium]|nr:RNA methyltransferase [Cryomorphaceae bacterium]
MTRRKNQFDKIPVDIALSHFLEKISPERRKRLQSVLALRSRYIVPVMEDIFQKQNAGAIIRTADCTGFQEVGIIEINNRYSLAPGIAKGAQKWVDTRIFDQGYADPKMEAIDYYRQKGFRLVGACPHTHQYSPKNLPLDKPVALFFGAEKEGLHPIIKSEMDDFVAIPMRGFTESYNVSVSAAIILQSLRQRLEHIGLENFQIPAVEQREILLQWVIRSIPKGVEQLDLWSKQFDD